MNTETMLEVFEWLMVLIAVGLGTIFTFAVIAVIYMSYQIYKITKKELK